METRVVPFHVEHLQGVEKQLFDFLGLSPSWLEQAKLFPQIGECFSAFVGDTLIACAGINFLWPGVGEAWAVITPGIFSHKKFFHRAVKEGMEGIIKTNKLFRVQTAVKFGFEKGRRWIERLGFKQEGVMRKYDRNRDDYWLYARLED